jgi:hypothetical protein
MDINFGVQVARMFDSEKMCNASRRPPAKDFVCCLRAIRTYMLQPCRAYHPHRAQLCCRCCQPWRSQRLLTRDTPITGMATAFCPAIISRPTTAFQFTVRRDQAAARQTILQAIGIMASGTISATPGFSADATTAAASARAGLGRRSGRYGIVGSLQRPVVIATIINAAAAISAAYPP